MKKLLTIFEKHKKLFFLFSIIYVLGFLLFFLKINYQKNLSELESWNSLVSKEVWSDESLVFQEKKLLKGEKISAKFVSEHSNLGTIAVYFNNHQRINQGSISFSLKSDDTGETVYQNNYPIDKIDSSYPYTFGFPLISDSANKNYLIEISSIDGTEDDYLSLNNQNSFLVKHVYSKNTFLSDKSLFRELFVGKFFNFVKPLAENTLYLSKMALGSYLLLIFITSFVLVFNKKIFDLFFRRSYILYPYILFFTTLLVAGYFSRIGVDPHHDGIVLKPAIDVSRGLILFKETFSQYGALSVYLQAASLKIFGEYLLVIRLLTALFYSLISVLLYYIWEKILSKNLAFLSVLIWLAIAPFYYLTFLPWSSVQALFFQLLSFIFMLFSFKYRSFKWDFALGVFMALTFWSKQNVGAYTLLSIVTISVIHFKDFKKTFSFLINNFIGFSVTSSVFMLVIFWQGAALDWIKQSFVYALHWAKTFGNKNPFLVSLFPKSKHTISLWSVLPIFTILTLLDHKIKKKIESNIPFYLSIFSLFSWIQYHPIPDPRHAYWASAPMVGLLFYYLHKKIIKNNKHNLKYLFFIVVLVFFFYHDLNFAWQTAKKSIALNSQVVKEENILKGIKLDPKKVEYFNSFESNFKDLQKDGRNLVTITPDALYLLFGDSQNYHPMYVNWGTIGSIYPDYNNIKDKYIDENRPIVIAKDKSEVPGYCKLEETLGYDKTVIMVPCSL